MVMVWIGLVSNDHDHDDRKQKKTKKDEKVKWPDQRPGSWGEGCHLRSDLILMKPSTMYHS